ncbi:alpha/beta fold hydrolase (plasmid) [Deinococcus psychrotolerans]|uniref:Alpha/beta fold hydrolase n=1 Tax=Deinococcus psychrotolerans TaxID=2489213 RepID=A0A3G8YI05_9DEIO|nr:alpha/beta fold hydrolase [Deinococcus psychrotolerans]AZI44480.1 alpha/beta fold hydrolase [Deinococcus psychrotolerans]
MSVYEQEKRPSGALNVPDKNKALPLIKPKPPSQPQKSGTGQAAALPQKIPTAKPAIQIPKPPVLGGGPKDRAALLTKLTAGEETQFISKLASAVADVAGGETMGRPLLANVAMGTTRALAAPQKGKSDKIKNYTMPVIAGDELNNRIRLVLVAAQKTGTLQATLDAFKTQNGKSIYAVLGERVRDTQARAKILNILPVPLDQQRITRDTFLENIAVGMSYSNESAATMNDKAKDDERRGGKPGEVLAAFGYKAGESLNGAWGLQMRIFTPDPKKAKSQPIVVAFRGTEGISFDPNDGSEGAIDTLIGDFAKKQPGVNQFKANQAWIDRVIKQAAASGQKITFVGHSLGGALAQEAAARYPQLTAGVVTFQAANIPQEDADKVKAYNAAHPEKAINARHYRVEGDTVPMSGEASLPGSINYFDRVSRPQGSQGAMTNMPASEEFARKNLDPSMGGVSKFAASQLSTKFPLFTMGAATKGHVIPILSTYMHGLSPQQTGPIDPKRQVLLQYGIQDENTLSHPLLKNGKPMLDKGGKPLMMPTEDVGAIFAGNYNTQPEGPTQNENPSSVAASLGSTDLHPRDKYPAWVNGLIESVNTKRDQTDPRIKAEAARARVMPEVAALQNGGAAAKTFEKNIAFNTAMHHLFKLAESAKTLIDFEAQARDLLKKDKLDMLQEDVNLAEQMNLDKSPRANAEKALKDLAGITPVRVSAVEFAVYGIPGVGTRLGDKAAEINTFIRQFSNEPTLDQYEREDGEGYEVQLDRRTLDQLDERRVKDVWGMFHPGDKK